MSLRPAGEAGGRTASRLLASFPWVVVVLGVGLLATLLLVALLSFRGPERQALPPAPAPPVLLPTPRAVTTPVDPSPTSVTPSPTRPPTTAATPSRAARTSSPGPGSGASSSASPQPLVANGGAADPAGAEVTARYEVTDSDRDSFRAELLLANRTDRSRDWRVELQFTDAVRSIRVYGGSGISVWTDGRGRYVLRGDLRPGEQERLALRIRRDGGGDQPSRCTVNGVDCVIG